MNPRAEALKKRTFTFALGVVRFCRILRGTWEGPELSDQLFRAGTRVGASYRSACRARSHPDFINTLGHVVEEADESVACELLAIFNQSQITAKSNAAQRNVAARRRPAPLEPNS